MRRRTWILVAAALLAALGAFVLIWFQPQKLFYDAEVQESLPSVSAEQGSAGSGGDEQSAGGDGATTSPSTPAGPVELASGTFISREHETVGTARVVRLADGQVIVRLEGFETSNGPALYVYLSANPADGEDALFDDDYVDLGPLKGNIGDQNYVVPDGVEAADWASVVIWCDRFSVSFGAADLAPATTT